MPRQPMKVNSAIFEPPRERFLSRSNRCRASDPSPHRRKTAPRSKPTPFSRRSIIHVSLQAQWCWQTIPAWKLMRLMARLEYARPALRPMPDLPTRRTPTTTPTCGTTWCCCNAWPQFPLRSARRATIAYWPPRATASSARRRMARSRAPAWVGGICGSSHSAACGRSERFGRYRRA